MRGKFACIGCGTQRLSAWAENFCFLGRFDMRVPGHFGIRFFCICLRMRILGSICLLGFCLRNMSFCGLQCRHQRWILCFVNNCCIAFDRILVGRRFGVGCLFV